MPRLSKIGAATLAAFGWSTGVSVAIDYLVVAGGAGAGGGNGGGGGGAGGFLTGTEKIDPTKSYVVTLVLVVLAVVLG
jgi:mucin-19